VERRARRRALVGGRQGEARSKRCGDEVVLSTWSGSSFQPTPPRVAAPAGTKPKDIVTGIMIPQPADRCGRTHRFVRAYQTPGATRADWAVGGQRAPSAAIME
jgi:hypothetical protein